MEEEGRTSRTTYLRLFSECKKTRRIIILITDAGHRKKIRTDDFLFKQTKEKSKPENLVGAVLLISFSFTNTYFIIIYLLIFK